MRFTFLIAVLAVALALAGLSRADCPSCADGRCPPAALPAAVPPSCGCCEGGGCTCPAGGCQCTLTLTWTWQAAPPAKEPCKLFHRKGRHHHRHR